MSGRAQFSFWHWLWHGSGGKPGIERLASGWVVFDILAGLTISHLNQADLKATAGSVLLPLAAILFGLSASWGAAAVSLVNQRSTYELAARGVAGIQNYVFPFFLGLLVIMAALGGWGLAAMGIFPQKKPTDYFLLEVVLFSLLSLSVRVVWQIALLSALLTINAYINWLTDRNTVSRREQAPDDDGDRSL